MNKKAYSLALATLSCFGIAVVAVGGISNHWNYSQVQKSASTDKPVHSVNTPKYAAEAQSAAKTWDFVLSKETLEKIDLDCKNGWYWKDNSSYYEYNTSHAWVNDAQLRYGTSSENGNIKSSILPETEGLLFGYIYDDGYHSINVQLYKDGRLRLNSSTTYMKMKGLFKGMTITVNYKSVNTNYRGLTCISENAEFASGSKTTADKDAEAVYNVTADGDVSFVPNGAMYLNSIQIGSAANALALVRESALAYMETLKDYPGMKAELKAVYDASSLPEGTSEADAYTALSNLSTTKGNIEKAVADHALMKEDITLAESILKETKAEDLEVALKAAKGIDAAKAVSSDYITAHKNLAVELSIYNSSTVDMSTWAFNTSSEKTVDRLKYYIDEKNHLAEFTGLQYESSLTSLDIPTTINIDGTEYAVVAMINRYQYTQSSITSVSLPKTMRSIGDNAFYNFSKLTYIDIPANVTNIGKNVFYGANNLQSIKLNSTTPPVCAGSFSGSSQKRIYIPDGCFHDYRLASQWSSCIIIPETPVTVTANITDAGDLGRLVLEKAGYLQEVNKLTVTGELNSDDWTSLKNMTNLIEVDLSGALNTYIPESQFNGKWAMEKVVLPSKTKTIYKYAFYKSGIKEMAFPETLTTINAYAFQGCNSLTEITLPSSLTSIGEQAFRECYYLTSVSIPNSVTSMGTDIFRSCTRLAKANIPEGISTLPARTFYDCDLESITIPASIKKIDSEVFRYNSDLAEVVFSEGLETIGSGAFRECYALDNLEMPSTLVTIESYAFYKSGISDIKLNEGLRYIKSDAFYDCDNLASITLPSSLRECSDSPFSYCDNLKKIYAHSVIPANTNNTCPIDQVDLTDIVLYVPAWSLQEYQLASGWSSFLTVEVTDYMPQNVVINKDFVFALSDELSADYRPNIELLWSDTESQDSYGYDTYERGNLTINSRSKLPVNNFSMYMSPYAKYYADYSLDRGYSYDRYRTTYNPTSLIVNGEMRAENVTLNMLAFRNRWQFISFPFDVKMSDIVPVDNTTQWVVREYSGENRANNKLDETWLDIKADGVLQAGKGYILHCYNGNSDLVEFTVSPVKESVNRQAIFIADNRTVALEENIGEFEHNRSWNLIGNPYPSFYDSRFLDFEAPITVWNSYNNSYTAYSPVDDSYILNPGEAFFVQRPVDQENITFNATGRQTHRHARILEESEAMPKKAASAARRTVCNITLTDGENNDRTRIVLNEKASMGYELNRDANKFMSLDEAMPQIYTVDGNVRYAINERPEGNAAVELGVHIGSNGTYTIALGSYTPCTITLEDRRTGTFTEITVDNGYTFEAEAGDIEGRFVIHFGKYDGTTGIDSAISNDATDADAPAYNLSGQRINADTYKGIMIKNGHKVVKK